ncbi:hypothetical protein CesoFtcFv8_000105, partial [Champsocephalus esox]
AAATPSPDSSLSTAAHTQQQHLPPSPARYSTLQPAHPAHPSTPASSHTHQRRLQHDSTLLKPSTPAAPP